MSEVRLESSGEESPGGALSDGSAALQPSEDDLLTLRFLVRADDQTALEALRHARRSMLREERTLGRDSGEPSLEEAVFSAVEIAWTVPRFRREWCLERLEELERRANRTLAELRGR